MGYSPWGHRESGTTERLALPALRCSSRRRRPSTGTDPARLPVQAPLPGLSPPTSAPGSPAAPAQPLGSLLRPLSTRSPCPPAHCPQPQAPLYPSAQSGGLHARCSFGPQPPAQSNHFQRVHRGTCSPPSSGGQAPVRRVQRASYTPAGAWWGCPTARQVPG